MTDKLYLCPNCDQYSPVPDPNDPIWPFCSETCYDTWANTHYGAVEDSDGEKHYSIEYMQRRLKEMGKGARRKP